MLDFEPEVEVLMDGAWLLIMVRLVGLESADFNNRSGLEVPS